MWWKPWTASQGVKAMWCLLVCRRGVSVAATTTTTTTTTCARSAAFVSPSSRFGYRVGVTSSRHLSSSSSSTENNKDNLSNDDTAATPSSTYRLLEDRWCFRGPVATGFGRGGKQLGFPTANLPSSLFQNALANVDNGVYFGWAVLEGRSPDDAAGPHKAVVNVGVSPTFAGAENPEKIIEAHLAVEDEPLSDFYGETMRLQLDAFMRPERKFPSFPALMAQITADVEAAKAALETEPYATFGKSDFLTMASSQDQSDPWIGRGGGDATASWEKTDMQQFL